MIDLLIKNAKVADGSGKEPYNADIAVEGGKIVSIAADIKADAAVKIYAQNRNVAPGFIDVHRHEDIAVFDKNYGEVQLRQGITSTISGNCGLSIAPLPKKYRKDILNYLKPIMGLLDEDKDFEMFSDYMRTLENIKLPLNFGMHAGADTIHLAVKGFSDEKLNREEIAEFHRYLQDALESGAFGVSLGIAYMPEILYSIEDFAQVLAPLHSKDIPLVTHIRGEGNLLYDAVKEVIEIAQKLNIPLHISHYKCLGKKNWGHLLEKTTLLIEKARSSGTKVTIDVYPWTAGASQLAQILPIEFLEGGLAKTAERLKDKEMRQKCKEILSSPQKDFENQIDLIGWENIMITSAQKEKNKNFIGKRMSEIAQETGKDPFDAAFDLLSEEDCNVSMVNFIASKEDIDTILKYPYSIIISDSIYPSSGMPHPRRYGTYPLILSEFVRDRKVLSLPLAVHKMTKAPADIFNIKNKGLIKEGYDADIVIFDLNKIKNNADYMKPASFGEGFDYVIAGGQIAVKDDVFLKTKTGKVLKRK